MKNILFLLFSCSEPNISSSENVSEQHSEEVLSLSTELGPVSAQVRLSPKQPKLGDPMVLTLRVETKDNVNVELPPFGEALGRFQIVDFSPNESKEPNIFIQRYTLQAPMSGMQTIPSLRVVFFDKRDGANEEEQEVLTEEITIEIASLLDEDAPLDLQKPRGRLEPQIDIPIWVWIVGFGVLGTVLSFWGWRTYHRWQVKVEIRSAYDTAIASLHELSMQNDLAIDDYYAQLSFILRRYIDVRFGIAVLEKTTPEFIYIARKSDAFSQDQLDFLAAFLQRSDDVKYAQQQPNLNEGDTEISLIRRFLEETKSKEEVEDERN